MLQYHFNWKTLSAMAGVTWWNFYFRLFPGAIKSPQVVEFLQHLLRHLPGKLLIIWDGLRAHRSCLVRDYLDTLGDHIKVTYLPPYSPDLNPVDYLWAWLKRHALANYCPSNFTELHTTARNKLKSAQKRPSIISACWMQATLW